MNEFNFHKLISKYAILLSIYYTLNLIWIYFLYKYFSQFIIENHNSMYEYISYIPRIFTAIFNIIFAILVYLDFKQNNIKSPLIVIVTLLTGFIGIALFFIQLIYENQIKKTHHNTSYK